MNSPDTTVAAERDLGVLLSYLLNRNINQSELIEALQISRSTFYEQRDKNTLARPANLISAARHFGLNPVELLMIYAYITAEDLDDVCARRSTFVAVHLPLTQVPAGNQHKGPPL